MSYLDRRQTLLGMGAALICTPLALRDAAAYDWQPIAPSEAGFAPDLEARLDKLIAEQRAWGLHGIVVVRNGRLVLERYFEGEDYMRGRPLGRISFTSGTLHDLRSISKSVVGLLYGIALEQGKVPPPEAPLYGLFPEHADLIAEPGRDRITIQHALTMTLGLEWDETSVPYSNPANSEIAMDRAPDRYRYILERRVVAEPGKRWTYCGGATALLGRIIAMGTGRPLHAFAREVLFDPLGIGVTDWTPGRDGMAAAASGLRMTPRGLARVGEMMADGGMAAGRQVVPAQWLQQATAPVISIDEMRRYGYQWYSGDFAIGRWLGWAPGKVERWWGAFGHGGQRLYVLPGLKLVVAINAGNYLKEDQGIPPRRVMREVVLASLQ